MTMKSRAPLFESLHSHHAAQVLSFHVPGHKSRAGQLGDADRYYHDILKIDMTEISGLDDLHHPEEVIREAQELAADCFGAEETYFLVGGSTSGNLALLTASCRRGELVLVQRDAHKSVLHGLMLAGARAVFITPRVCKRTGLKLGVALEDLKLAMARYPEAKGLFITNPSYYGVAADIGALANLLHDHGKWLLVDEAHGAHFGFHPALPGNAMAAGADAAVQSTHKMLTSMTMGAMLHVQGERINRAALKKALAMLQSSSPSYPIMASLDLSRKMMHEHGEASINAGLQAVHTFNDWIKSQSGWGIGQVVGGNGIMQDPFKLALYDRTGRLSGYALKEALERHGCFAELADPVFALLVFSLASTVQDAERLVQALAEIDLACEEPPPARPWTEFDITTFGDETISEPVAFDLDTVLAADQDEIEYVPLEQCEGRIAAEMIVPYPPGIPILHQGEAICAGVAAYLERLADLGSRFHGHDVTAHRTLPVLSTGSTGPA
ncbi:aminotransferase class I/II-fold pyridoxal phosphate-dependent enzyme [Paenibacillus cremeus]|uniref:Aminotransferase class I/II-fold pyridoxal phosphate-dependent enzyme n=1 Tax=Paenibacillus cremeus TaxID=2163881 RepID=A0A559K3W1_9BACL|nr:aminotransferase class I/II-fold pyridoxal phosphate-dependent enzyme [Paenibacillus cremeus]TVY06825.1 aminotransferase class I/II-fold pyridoxal phosphate-dependent enzyme [Paenibacillus cremeus]